MGASLVLSTLISKDCSMVTPSRSVTCRVTGLSPRLVLVGVPLMVAVPLLLSVKVVIHAGSTVLVMVRVSPASGSEVVML